MATEEKNKKELRLEAKRLKAQEKQAREELKKQQKEERKKRNSKGKKIFKFFFILFFLLGSAAAVFFIGWVHPPMSGNQYAVVMSKTNGYRETLLKADEFLWMPQKLLPTNTSVLVYTLQPQTQSISVSGKLPSGEIYSLLLEGAPNFSFELDCRITYQLNKESLIDLAKDGILPDQTEELLSNFQQEFQPMVVDLIQKKSTDSEFVSFVANDFNRLQEVLIQEIESRNPFISVEKLIINSIDLPDIRLYNEARELYFQMIDNQPPTRLQQLQEEVNQSASQLLKFQTLEELAKLLEKYPILMEYAKINPQLKLQQNEEK